MSASTLQPPPETNGKVASVAEYVRSLQPEDKQAAFLALLREALEQNGDCGLLQIDDEDGNFFGYFVPPKAAAERANAVLPELTPEREAELAARQSGGGFLSEVELRAWLTQATPPQNP